MKKKTVMNHRLISYILFVCCTRLLFFLIKSKQGNRICLSQSKASETFGVDVPSFSKKKPRRSLTVVAMAMC